MKKDRLLAVSFSFLFSMTAAGLWEIVEYVIYLFFGNDSQYAVAPYAAGYDHHPAYQGQN